jgi:Tfp pilus assembly protein PilX
MKRLVKAVQSERGVGLLMALLVLVAIGAIAMGIISSVATDRRLASYNASRALAMDYAEAGVYEAYERIRAGDVPSSGDPKMVAQIFRTTPGTVPAVGTDTLAMGTGQPDGQWLPYSSPTKGPDVLTIRYMTNAAKTGIYRYDVSQTPPIQGKTGDPIFIITSTARAGLSRASVEATVAMQTLNPNLLGAYVGDGSMDLKGNIYLYGEDYDKDTPYGTGQAGARDPTYETANPAIAGAWATSDIKTDKNVKAYGNPATSKNQPGFYAGPWTLLNMGQDQFWAWVGPPNPWLKKNGDIPRGIVYLGDPKDKPQKGRKKFSIKGGYGDGLLYVNGDLKVNGDFTYRGLIYAEGQVDIKGNFWCLGSVVSGNNGKAKISKKTSPITVVGSKGAIQQYLGKYGNPFVMISWKEQ